MKIIIGLGSNLGRRKKYLVEATHRIINLNIINQAIFSSTYESEAQLPEGAPANWNKNFLNLAIMGETSLAVEDVLVKIKGIEKDLGRQHRERWAPREIDIDILFYGDRVVNNSDLKVPHPRILERPFCLLPAAELAPQMIFPGAGAHAGSTLQECCQSLNRPFDFNTRRILWRPDEPQLVGVLNVTPDSFSDGGEYINVEKAYQRALQMIDEGASVIDIGAESTRPGANSVTPKEEWKRIGELISELRLIIKDSGEDVEISLDTRNSETAELGIESGIDWINDVGGLSDKRMQILAAKSKVKLLIMHSLSIPADKSKVFAKDADVVSELLNWGRLRAQELMDLGIEKNRVIFDPGIGFGKTAEQSLKILRSINNFAELGLPILVGHSRKSFLNLFTDRDFADRDVETLAASIVLSQKNIQYLRVHNVNWHRRAYKVMAGLRANEL